MSVQRGHTPFERLRRKLEVSERRCVACGDRAEGNWRAVATGGRVRYQQVCPTCEAVDTRELHLDVRR